jgi:hypothetical protein
VKHDLARLENREIAGVLERGAGRITQTREAAIAGFAKAGAYRTTSHREPSHHDFCVDARWKDLLHCGMAMRDPLLVGVEQQLVPCRTVRLDTKRKRIAIH